MRRTKQQRAGIIVCQKTMLVLLMFLIIESLHIRISALFLGKDGTELAYRVSGELK